MAGREQAKGTINDIVSFITSGQSFLLATHINPEGDAIGSAVALAMALEAMGKRAVVYDKDGVPDIYAFMPGSGRVRTTLEGIDTKSLSLIILDCNHPERAGLGDAAFGRSAVIDHHATESGFGDIRWIEPDAPACGLMVYGLIKALGVKFTPEMAQNLYIAIAVDTGTFRYNNTTAESLRAAAELVEAGTHPGEVAESLYEMWSVGRFKLLCRTLGGLELTDGIAVMTVTRATLADTGATAEDTENFAGFPRAVSGVRVSALIRETDENSWKVSLRSKRDYNVAAVAESFGGGGHKNAAGFKVKGNISEVKASLIARIKELAG